MKINNITEKKNNLRFIVAMALFAIVVGIRYFEHGINAQDTTAFAFSYKYGFISRAFMGTFLQILDNIFPQNLMSYKGIYYLSYIATIVLIIMLLVLFYCILRKIDSNYRKYAEMIMVFIAINAFPMYLTIDNFGRLDVYLTIIMLLSVLLMVEEKLEWLIVPLSILAMLIHHGYVFMNINIILVFLLYKAFRHEGNKRKYYLSLFIITFLAVSVLFIYFEMFSHIRGEAIYKEVYENAASLSVDGNSVNDSLLKHEILGLDVYDDEYSYRRLNQVEFPKYFILFSPIIIAAGLFIKNIMCETKEYRTKFMHIVILLGGVTVLPEMILKVDYGRYAFALILYYALALILLLSFNDVEVKRVITAFGDKYNKEKWIIPTLMLYAMLFVPYRAVRISDVVSEITYFIYGFH